MRAEELRRERDCLRVVAGRVRDDAARERVVRERRDLVVRAAELERAAALEALRLQVDARADALVERARGDDRRAVRDSREPCGRGLDVRELDHRQGLQFARKSPNPQSEPVEEEVRGAGAPRVSATSAV